MRLPNGDQAIVEMAKLTDYCLSFEHPRGRHKARRFLSALGLTREHAGELRDALLVAAADSDTVVAGESDRFGRRYVIDFEYVGPGGSAWVRSGWIVRADEIAPRLTTCYVIGERP